MKDVSEPIFIVGTGRCGSTVFHHMLAEHAGLAFLTGVLEKDPENFAQQRRVLNAWNVPLIGSAVRRFDAPAESWRFWNNIMAGFSTTFRDFRSDDVLASAKPQIREAVSRVLTAKRPRLLIKLTGWTRVGFIKEVFPDAKIIHVIRDPHPFVHSMLKVSWWHGWFGPHQWRWGELSDEERAIWEQSGQAFPVLASIGWKKIMEAYWESLTVLPPSMRQDVISIHYRTLCEQPRETLEQVFTFLNLEQRAETIERISSKYKLVNQDHKWKKSFTDFQQKQLEKALDQFDWQDLLVGPRPNKTELAR